MKRTILAAGLLFTVAACGGVQTNAPQNPAPTTPATPTTTSPAPLGYEQIATGEGGSTVDMTIDSAGTCQFHVSMTSGAGKTTLDYTVTSPSGAWVGVATKIYAPGETMDYVRSDVCVPGATVSAPYIAES